MNKDQKLEELENLENAQRGANYDPNMGQSKKSAIAEEQEKQEQQQHHLQKTTTENQQRTQPTKSALNEISSVDGYKSIDRSELSHGGRLYPESWRFAYRCPKAVEIANFSTINEQDQPAVFSAIEDLICKCVKIVDVETEEFVNTKEINDGDRLFFMLKLREFYLPESYISYNTICPFCKNSVEVRLVASTLRYPTITEKMLSYFDGRIFRIPASELRIDNDLVFYIPTLKNAAKIFHYLLKSYRDQSSDNKNNEEAFTKQFLFIAPFLFETGRETMEEIKIKFKRIREDGKLLQAYTVIASKLIFSNKQEIAYTHDCGSEEEAAIRFPGGWKEFFVDKSEYNGLFE